jgi:hypothetical protein
MCCRTDERFTMVRLVTGVPDAFDFTSSTMMI